MKKLPITLKQAVIAVSILIICGGIFVAITQLQKQQELRGRATQSISKTSQSATAICSTLGNTRIRIHFTNKDTQRSMMVIAEDQQSGEKVNLGVVGPSKSVTGEIDTKKQNITDGEVSFTMSLSDNPEEQNIKQVSYDSIGECEQAPVCTDVSQSVCSWDPLPDTVEYNVTVRETTSDTIVEEATVPAETTSLSFPSKAGETYECSVNAVNACGVGKSTQSPLLTCPMLPTPTPTVPVCKEDESICTWDSLPGATEYTVTVIDTETGETIKSGTVPAPTTQFAFPYVPGVSYQCSVSVVNQCGPGDPVDSPPVVCEEKLTPTPTPTDVPIPSQSPTPTPTPTPTDVPIPSLSPTPTPTNTPTPTPTETPIPTPTNTPVPTPTQAPTPTPTNTPTPTATPLPTLTPTPTNTPTPTSAPIAQEPAPTRVAVSLAPTGDFGTTTIAAGISIVLAVIGAVIFFIL